jgi:cell division protein FtsN
MPVPPPVQVINPVIKIIPKLPDPNSGRVYRIQVAAFSHAALAQVCFDRLKAAGLSPAYEKNGSLYRVVLSGIKAADVSNVAQRLTAAGFTEAWIREESRP